MKPLMVLESAWHYRKATQADLPQCHDCDHHKDGQCDNRNSFAYAMFTYGIDGCNRHSKYSASRPQQTIDK